jgi:hypothetical protein
MFSKMALTIKTTVNDNTLRVAFEGDYTFSELIECIREIRTAADASGCDQTLIDATGVNGRMTESEKFFAGTKIAELFGPKLKAAVVMPSGDVTKMGEMAAVNRGARLLVTESRAEATAWLTGAQLRTVV